MHKVWRVLLFKMQIIRPHWKMFFNNKFKSEPPIKNLLIKPNKMPKMQLY